MDINFLQFSRIRMELTKIVRGYSKFSIILIIIIILTGLAIRVAVLLPDVKLEGDSKIRYDPIARNLVLGNGFSAETQPPFTPDNFEQPGYPYFVAAIYWISNGSRKAVVAIQIIFELGILLLIIKILQDLAFSRRIKFIAFSVSLICPFLPLYSKLILTEILATFFVTLACYFFIKLAVKKSYKATFFAGLASGTSLLIRPDTLIVIIFMITAAGFVYCHRRKKRGILEVSIILVIIILVLLPWTLRNYYFFQTIRPLGNVTGQVNFAYSKWLDTWMDHPKYLNTYWWHSTDKEYTYRLPKDKIPKGEIEQAEYALFVSKQQGSFEGKPSEIFISLTNKAKEDRPFSVIILTPLWRSIRTWLRMPALINQNELQTLAQIFWLFLIFFVVVGLITILYQNWSSLFLILIAVMLGRLILPLISSLAIESRYMIEALPVYFIFASIGVSKMYCGIKCLIFSTRG